MSKIKWSKLPVVLFLVGLTVGSPAQTLGELAELQRQKIDADSKPKTEAVPAIVKATPKSRKEQPPEPMYSVHAIYSKQGKLVAEVTDGNSLVTAQVGFLVGRFRVLDINETTIVVRESNSSANTKSVPVGGRF